MNPRLGETAPTASSSRSDRTRRDLAAIAGRPAASRRNSPASPSALLISRAPPWGAKPGTSLSVAGIRSSPPASQNRARSRCVRAPPRSESNTPDTLLWHSYHSSALSLVPLLISLEAGEPPIHCVERRPHGRLL